MRSKQSGALGTALGTSPGEIAWATVPDAELRGGADGPLSGRPLGQEYDGLESGELAWIMGRKYLGDNNGVTLADGQIPMQAFSQSAHALGSGYGPDRMQRLAYTSWMEAYFRAVFGNQHICLNNISLTGPKQVYVSDELKKYRPYLAGACVLASVDLPHVINARNLPVAGGPPPMLQYRGDYDKDAAIDTANRDAAARNPQGPWPVRDLRVGGQYDGLGCGIFVLESGPFLRGKVVNDDPVEMLAAELRTPNRGQNVFHSVPRNMGDRLAFEALYAEMRARNFFDWSPDGMVLSKLESPAGEPLSSAELDARQAQLFNVCIQGPALAKTWTGDPKMHCMPLDKVFIVMVADVNTVVNTDGSADLDSTAANRVGAGATAKLAASQEKYSEWLRPPAGAAAPTPANVRDAVDAAEKEFADAPNNGKLNGSNIEYVKLVNKLFTEHKKSATAVGQARTDAAKEVARVRSEMDACFGPIANDPTKNDETNFENVRTGVKKSRYGIESSVMTNFRLKRVTSSFLAATSACVFKQDTTTNTATIDPASRCGLRFGMNGTGSKEYTGEYIIGGWCVGTVIDSAASRASVGNMVKSSPASMAININVNIEWWSGDDLYRRYMDVGGTVLQRGMMTKRDKVADPTKPQARSVGIDVPTADQEEAIAWKPFAA